MRERKMGYRCDIIFCENRIGHDESVDYGASEVGRLYDGDQGTKKIRSRVKKTTQVSKGYVGPFIIKKKDDRSKIQTIGSVHSGLESFFMTADRPVKYDTRIIKSRRT